MASVFGSLFIILPIIVVAICVMFFASSYRVVPPHEAHVVVSGARGRRVYMSREGFKSSYFAFPFTQRRAILPLRNKQLLITGIPLRDKNLAKFLADVVCWVNITDPIAASERIGDQSRISNFTAIEDDIKNLIEAVTRNSSMKMDVVTLMSERMKFSHEVEAEVQSAIGSWGVQIVDLECIHFIDQAPYTVISDLEKRQSSIINSQTRQLVAEKNRDADVVESNSQRETEVKRAENEMEYKMKQIERDEELGKKSQEKEMSIAEMAEKANRQKVEADRMFKVGSADVEREARVKTAEGTAEADFKIGKAQADVTSVTGLAEASVLKAKAFAEAEGIDKKAEAQKKYNQAGAMAIEIVSSAINASRDIEIAKYQQLGQALQKASVNVVSTGEREIFGIPTGAETGIALGGMFKALKDTGFDVEGILKGVGTTLKDTLGNGKKGGGTE